MKRVYEFTVEKEEEKDVQSEEVNPETNEKVIRINKVKQKIPYKFYVAKPTRALSEEASLFYAVKLSESIKAGLLTIPQLEKKYSGDVLNKDERQKQVSLIEELIKAQETYQKLKMVKDEDLTEDQKEELTKITTKISELQLEIQENENVRTNLFEHTAETRARNAVLNFWITHLAFKDNDTPFFGEGSLDDRMKKYDEIVEDGDEFFKEVSKRFMYYVSFYIVNRTTEAKEFEKLESLISES